MAKVGRKSKLDNLETVLKLNKAFSDGSNVSKACSMSGISRNTYYARLKNNRQFRDIFERFQKNNSLKARVLVVQEINKGNWRAAAWYLARYAKTEFSVK